MSATLQGQLSKQNASFAVRLWWHVREFRNRLRRSHPPRSLRLRESLALGEKRFVAVVQFESERFLVGGGANNVSLLARLGETPDFAAVLTEWCERQR